MKRLFLLPEMREDCAYEHDVHVFNADPFSQMETYRPMEDEGLDIGTPSAD